MTSLLSLDRTHTPLAAGSGRGLILALTLLLIVGIELSQGYSSRSGAANMDRGSRVVLTVCLVPGILLDIFAPRILPGADIGLRGVCFALGEAILLAGCALRLWAIRTLGRYFTREVMVSSHQSVVATGPYRIVRHPSYSALLLYAIGAGLVSDNWLGLAAITALMLIALAYRIRVEEQALTSVLGEAYSSYAARHKRLVPFVW